MRARAVALALLVSIATTASAAEAAAGFTVGARVVRSGSVAVADGPAGGEGRPSLRVGRGAPRAGIALAPERAWRTATVGAAALADGVALPSVVPGQRVVVVVLLDGHPSSIRFVEEIAAARGGHAKEDR